MTALVRKVSLKADPTITCVLLLVCATALVLRAQQSTGDVPTFRTSVEAVAFEVFVTDAAGKPVTDLTVDEFELLEDGKAQPITTFASTVIPIDPPRGKVNTWAVPADVATNTGAPGRTYIFALDESVIREDVLRTRLFLRQFLERYFGPNDLGAVLLVGRGLGTDGQTFTSSAALLLKAIDKWTGGWPIKDPAPPQFPYAPVGVDLRINTADPDTRRRLSTLKDLTASLARLPGRKTVLYFTGRIGFDMFSTVDYHGGVMMLAAEDAHAIISAATRANVIFYPINPAGIEIGFGSLDDKMDLTSLATVTGGFALSDSNSFMQAFARVQQESSAYYTLGFNSGYAKRDGRLVRVDVKVTRPGLRVRGREGYLAPLGEKRAKELGGDSSPALSAMASPVLLRGVSMQVAAAPFRSPTRDATVPLVVEIDPDTLGLRDENGTRRGTVEITYTATDTRKRAYLGGRHTFQVSLPPDGVARTQAHGLRMVSALALPPGTFELRVAAASGAYTGSVVHQIDVPDFTNGKLALSGIALTANTAGMDLTLRPPRNTKAARKAVKCNPPSCIVPLSDEAPSAEDALSALPAPAIARRLFQRDEALLLYAEVYDNRGGAGRRVTVDVTLENESRSRRTLLSETRESGGDGKRPATHAFSARAALNDLPPGSYLLRVEARTEAGGTPDATRAIPIDVR